MRFLILLACSLITNSVFSQGNFQLGVNLDDNGAFVNIINHTNRYSNVSSYDSLGWPKSNFDLVLLDGRPVTEWNGIIDDPETFRVNYSGRYKCSFTGIANINATGTSVTVENKAYDSPSNTSTFDLVIGGFPDANHGLVILVFTATQRTPASSLNTGITNLKVNRPGYALNTTKTFTDEFISLCKAADFACYRYYNLQNIWDGEPVYPARTTWAKRKTPLDATQKSMQTMNGKAGTPILYPNPAKDYITILPGITHLPVNSKIAVYSILGELVLTTVFPEDSRIDVSGLPAGLYFLRMSGMVNKLIKY